MSILIIDDNVSLCEMLALHMDDLGYEAHWVTSSNNVQQALEQHQPQMILLDHQLPDISGIEMMPTLKRIAPHVPIILMASEHDENLAQEAIAQGAFNYVQKPIDTNELEDAIESALTGKRQHRANARFAPIMIGSSRAIEAVTLKINEASKHHHNVLIKGDIGTGKEMTARTIHHNRNLIGPFIHIKCATIADYLLEAELFGEESNLHKTDGKLSIAKNGTLYFEDIADLSPSMQSKLLAYLKTGTFKRVDGTEELRSNVRIISATKHNLKQLVQQKEFNEELFFRLNVVETHMPTLQERIDDLRQLVPHFLNVIAMRVNKTSQGITDEAFYTLELHEWPGNITELEHVLTQALLATRTGVIMPHHITFHTQWHMHEHQSGIPLEHAEEDERNQLRHALLKTNGHKGKTCTLLGISRDALDYKMQKYGIYTR